MTFETEMQALMPNMKAFAIKLCQDVDRAEDLVQDTLLRALQNRKQFEEGTNLRAWLFTILRNTYFSLYRRRRREKEDREGVHAAALQTPAAQEGHMELLDLMRVWQMVPADQREALVLVGVSGFSYEEAARVADCAVGTIKSRVHRARVFLAAALHEELPKSALEDAWEKVVELITTSDEDDMPSILQDAAE